VIPQPIADEKLKEQLVASEQLELVKKRIGRECGACTLCCKVLSIEEIGKPSDAWCRHCKPGRGCSIYEARPGVCRGFACLWLINEAFGDEWFPARAKIVVDMHKNKDGKNICRFHVDPAYSNRWREEPYYSQIKRTSLIGLRGDLGFYYQTIVSIRGKWTMILPQEEREWGPGIAYHVGDEEFKFVRCENYAHAKLVHELMSAYQSTITKVHTKNPELAGDELMTRVVSDQSFVKLMKEHKKALDELRGGKAA
jgi:hypothetical protein